MSPGERRYFDRRASGSKDLAVALPLPPVENDHVSAEAEEFFAQRFGLKVDKRRSPDRCDFMVGGYSIDIKWTPVRDGSICTFIECRNKCDIYVLVSGPPNRMRLVGWEWGKRHRRRIGDLGHGIRNVTRFAEMRKDVDAMMDKIRGGFARQ